jgi:hypothetical protein
MCIRRRVWRLVWMLAQASERDGITRTARASGTSDSVLGGGFVAGAGEGGLLAAGAGRLLGADAGIGLATAGCWLDHFEAFERPLRWLK